MDDEAWARAAVLQSRLPEALAANAPGSTTNHVVVEVPSFTLNESLSLHYGARVPALEHRYLVSQLPISRIPSCETVSSAACPRIPVSSTTTSLSY